MKKETIGAACAGIVILIIIAGFIFFQGNSSNTSSSVSSEIPKFQGSLSTSGGYFDHDTEGNRIIIPEIVPAGEDYIAITSGFHELALRANGSIVCWGGNGLFDQCNTPNENDFIAIAGGNEHSLALRSNGTIVCWGKRCGNEPEGNDYSSISTTHNLNLALRSNGSVAAWGDNLFDQENVPSENDFVMIAAGDYNGLALRSNGTIVCWGAKEYCDVPPGNDYVIISSSRQTNLAIKSSGELIAWDPFIGWNHYVPPGNDYVAISNSVDGHHLALRSDGRIVCWGETGLGVCNISSSKNNIAISAGSGLSLAITNPHAKEILAAEWQKTKARVKPSPGNASQQPQPLRTPVYPVKYVINATLPETSEKIMTYTVMDSGPLNPFPLSRSYLENNPSTYIPYKEFVMKKPSAAIEEFKTHRLSVSQTYLGNQGPIENANQIVVTNISVAYRDYPTASGTRCIQPVYSFYGFVEKDGIISYFLHDYVPATENLVEFDFLKKEAVVSPAQTVSSK